MNANTKNFCLTTANNYSVFWKAQPGSELCIMGHPSLTRTASDLSDRVRACKRDKKWQSHYWAVVVSLQNNFSTLIRFAISLAIIFV